MKYITNISIDPITVEYVKTHSGDIRPKETIEDYQKENSEKWINAGYDRNKVRWEVFYEDTIPNCNQQFPWDNVIGWWVSKLTPGDIFPFHLDTFPNNQKVTRYWIACEDHQPGHVFMYNKEILSDYKAGDVYEIPPGMWHGAANIGFTTKLSLQVVINNN